MNEHSLQKALSKLNIGDLQYFDSLGSTNDEALAWAAQGAPDLSMVVANEQTSGRGREGRRWYTPAGTALAVSLILRPRADELSHLSRIVGLAAISVAEALRRRSLTPQIKWPNDVLLDGKKVAGILVESTWNGEAVDNVVIGIGMNVADEAVPPVELLHFPATSLEEVLESRPRREVVLRDIVAALIEWRPRLGSNALIEAWEENLAFRGQEIQITGVGGRVFSGMLLGLESDGSLRMQENGNPVTVRFGDVRLRPSA